MTIARDYGTEIDALRAQLSNIQELVSRLTNETTPSTSAKSREHHNIVMIPEGHTETEQGSLFYSGRYRGENRHYRWEPQERQVVQLLDLDGEKAAKVLAALGHQQRLDILRTVLKEPLTGPEIVERLNMGTTGQLYHHIKALMAADLLTQEERGGKYSLPSHRSLPLLLLLAATSDLLDTSDYMALAETRTNVNSYFGAQKSSYDALHLLLAVMENTILEHQAGYCNQVSLFLHSDGSLTVADNGRGIPVQALPNTNKTNLQTVLTDISQFNTSASFVVPGSEKGITIAVVNALSQRLSVEVRRDGKIYKQDYRHGIPQSELLTIGVTNETGTIITFVPDKEIFCAPFDIGVLSSQINNISDAYPNLTIHFHSPSR